MLQPLRIVRRSLATLLAIPLFAGCGGDARRPAHSVNGTLLIGGKPAAGAHLIFHPVEEGRIARAVGITKPDGSFRLTTYQSGDGAPQGEYAVTIFWPDPSLPADDCEGGDLVKNHDLLCGLYASAAKTPLRATIGSESNEIILQAADLSGLFKKNPPQSHQPKPGAL